MLKCSPIWDRMRKYSQIWRLVWLYCGVIRVLSAILCLLSKVARRCSQRSAASLRQQTDLVHQDGASGG